MLKGGRSLERQVSLRSGARVEDALERLGHEVVALDVGADLIGRLREERPDVAFVALHGRDGEDGTVQELLEILGIPYTGSGVLACSRAMDKVITKHLLERAGIPTPDFFAFNQTAFRELGAADILPAIAERLDFPIVVKPSRQGSALGIKFARTAADVPGALVSAFSYDERVLLERYVDGRDLAVSVLDGDSRPEALPVVEAVPRDEDFYDFEARYEIGRTDFVCPADLPEGVTERAQELALTTYGLLGCFGFARVDLMLDEDGELAVLEANAIPGLTDTSLLPQAAEAAGIDFDELIERILERASARESVVSRPGRLARRAAEVLGRDVVEEVLELLDDLLLVLDLVLELDRRLGDDLLGGEDRGARADGQRERIGGTRVDLHLAAAHLEGDGGVEGVLAQLGDRDAGAGDLELGQHVVDQVVRHRPRGVGPLELHQDGRGLRVADPDRKELVPLARLEQDDRLLADHVEADAVDDHLLHAERLP